MRHKEVFITPTYTRVDIVISLLSPLGVFAETGLTGCALQCFVFFGANTMEPLWSEVDLCVSSLPYPITQVHLAERVKNARKTHGDTIFQYHAPNARLFIIPYNSVNFR